MYNLLDRYETLDIEPDDARIPVPTKLTRDGVLAVRATTRELLRADTPRIVVLFARLDTLRVLTAV